MILTYKIISLVDGSTKSCDLVNLSQSLSLNCEVLREVDGSHEAVGFVSHETLVFFAVEFADYALKHYAQKKIPEAEDCITLTRKWLENHDSVSNEELKSVANVAYAAYAVINAADNAAIYAAINAANSAYDAAAAAINAAYNAAAYAAYDAKKSTKKEQERQGSFILSYFDASVV